MGEIRRDDEKKPLKCSEIRPKDFNFQSIKNGEGRWVVLRMWEILIFLSINHVVRFSDHFFFLENQPGVNIPVNSNGQLTQFLSIILSI